MLLIVQPSPLPLSPPLRTPASAAVGSKSSLVRGLEATLETGSTCAHNRRLLSHHYSGAPACTPALPIERNLVFPVNTLSRRAVLSLRSFTMHEHEELN